MTVQGTQTFCRNMDLLRYVYQNGPITQAQAFRWGKQQELSQPTIYRMLAALVQQKLVMRSVIDKHYSTNIQVIGGSLKKVV